MESRTRNSTKNMISGLFMRSANILLAFFSRTIFIKILGDNCLGLDGLFTSILSMLSLADLGFGEAITFYLYKPIAENDFKRIILLVNFYKKAYRIVGLLIFGFGIAILPFLDNIINIEGGIDYNVYLVFMLYLLNTAVSYWLFSYTQSFLIANQKQYLVNNVSTLIYILTFIFEVIFLFITKNYYIYLFIRLAFSIIKNIIMYYCSSRKYSYVREKNNDVIEKSELKELFKDIYAIYIVKVASKLFTSTDNLFLSGMFNTVLAGYNSNYVMIVSGITIMINVFTSACSASVGNYYATNSKEKTRQIYEIIDFLNYWIVSICFTCVFTLINHFISLWWGETYTLSIEAVLLISINFYIPASLNALFSFRQSMGLFRAYKYNQLIAAIVNIILDFLLGHFFGLIGIFAATTLANLLFAVYPFIQNLYKEGFDCDSKPAGIKWLAHFLINILIALLIYTVEFNISISWIGLLIKLFISFLSVNVILFLIHFKSNDFKLTKEYILKKIKKDG